MCVLSSEFLLIYTAQNRLKIKRVEFKIFRAILTKNCRERTIINKPSSSFIYLSKTNGKCLNTASSLSSYAVAPWTKN